MTADTIDELIKRVSVRSFTGKKIPHDLKMLILEAAVNAPSAGCQQLYTIIDVTDQSVKEELAVTCDNQPFIAKADMVLVFCADCRKWWEGFLDTGCEPRLPGEGDLLLAVTDAAIAAQNAVTAAWSLGIGSCYIGDVMENCEKQRKLLKLPPYVFPAVMVVFGYPEERQLKRKKPERSDMKYIVAENEYPVYTACDRQEMFFGSRDLSKERDRNRTGKEETGISEEYISWMRAFCSRKYNSDFSKEMTRSVRKYLKDFYP